MHVEWISFSALYCNDNAFREATWKEHFSEDLFWIHVFKTANLSTFIHS